MPDEASTPYDPESADDVTGFDLDAWIDDAKPPQRSMTVYRRADLMSELDELERKIRIAESGETASAEAGLNGLKAEWDKLAQKISDSAVTITVRAITDDAAKMARADAKAEGVKAEAAKEWEAEGYDDDVVDQAEDEAAIDGMDDDEREALIRRRKIEARRGYIQRAFEYAAGEHMLVRLLVRPKMTIEQVRSLSEQIGSAQRDKLMALPMQATQELRPVSGNFSQPSSKARSGGTSSKGSGRQGRGGSRR